MVCWKIMSNYPAYVLVHYIGGPIWWEKDKLFPHFPSIFCTMYIHVVCALFFSRRLNYILVKGLFQTFLKGFRSPSPLFSPLSFFSLCRKFEADLKMVCGKAVRAQVSQISITTFNQYLFIPTVAESK